MFTSFFEKKTDTWIEEGKCSREDRDIVIYGLSMGTELILFIVTTLIIGALMGLLFQSIAFLCSYYLIRTFAGGYHCKVAINCYLFSCGIVAAGLVIIILAPERFHDILAVFFLIVGLPIIIKKAPVEAVNKPLDEIEKKRYRRIVLINAFVESIILVGLIFFDLGTFALTIGVSIFTASIMLIIKEKT